MRPDDWALATLLEYLRIPSVSAHGQGLAESVSFLTRVFRESGLEVRTAEAGGPPVVLAWTPPAPRSVLFYNHYDVQPADPLEEWISPPFEPAIRDGHLYARGVADNKANLIARIAAVRTWTTCGAAPPVQARFLVEGEEEIGSPHLPPLAEAEAEFLRADLVVWESSYRDERNRPQIVLGCKGIIHGELVARGARTDLHSSRGVIVPNPAVRLARAIASIRDDDGRVGVEGFYDDVRVPTAADLRAIEDIPFEEDALRDHLGISTFIGGRTGPELKKAWFFEPAFNICGLRSGYTGEGHKTVLPCEAVAKFDIRIVPDQRPEDILAKVRRHLDREGFPDVEIRSAGGYPAARTPPDHPAVEKVARAAEAAWGIPPVRQPLMPMSGPMYLFARRAPVAGIGVGHARSNIHAPNESIRLDDFRTGIVHVARLLEEMAR